MDRSETLRGGAAARTARRRRGARRGIPRRAAVALGVLLLAGCGTAAPGAPAPGTAGGGPVTATTAPPEPVVPPAWPLTGVPVAEIPTRPALAVKIENPRRVRPQTGLEAADVVWEQVVEGGVTRFVAVYHSTIPAEVGPIRSVRPVDPAIVAPMKGLIAFSGGQPRFVEALVDAGVQVISEDAGDRGFRRDGSRRVPHNVFGDPAQFLAQADARHSDPPDPQLGFAPRPDLATAVVAGTAASTVTVTLSPVAQPGWAWDAASSTWLRTETGEPATAASGARLAATNVVALRVDVVDSGTRDTSGAVVPATRLVGTGAATVATGGRALTATWSKDGPRSTLRLRTDDGGPVLLAPGTTWFELVPNGTGSVGIG